MRIYSVFELRTPEAGRQGLVLVKEGFCWPALLFGPLWALGHRMWPVAAGIVAIGLVLAFLPQWFWSGGVVADLGTLALLAVLGVEGNDLRELTLRWQGYDFSGVVGGRGLADAEQRLFTAVGPAFYSQ